MKFKHNWKKGKKREMLSYEDKPIEEYERDENKEKKSLFSNNKIRNVVIILAVLVIAVGLHSVWKNISPASLQDSISSAQAKGNGFPVKIEGKSVDESDTGILSGNFAYISDTQFQILNNNGGLVSNKRVKFASPAMTSCNKYALIYDREGSGYRIESSSGTIYEGEADDDIFDAEILDNGCYAILSKKSGYSTKLTVYNSDNTQKYAYYFSQCYATDVSLDKDVKHAVVCGLDASEGSMVSRIYILDFTKEEPIEKIEFKDSTIYSVDFLNNGNISAIGNKSAMIITSDYKNKYDFTYNGYNLASINVVDDGVFISLSPFTDGKSCEIWHITQNGFTTVTKTELSTTSMDVMGKTVALLSNNTITLFDTSTQTSLKSYDAGIDAKSIRYTNSNTIYVVGTTEIRAVSLK